MKKVDLVFKLIFDYVMALILFLVLLPIFLLISLIIKLSSKGPIFFKQNRIGKNKKIFQIYKFRTMYIDTPKDKPTHLLETPENFITPIGNFLRKTSLDELPQLLNILMGDMSFVGPRPALYNQNDLIDLREEYGVHRMMPGITGYAQVTGRDELPIDIKAERDRYYIDHFTFFFDIKLLVMTVFAVATQKGVVEGQKKNNP